MYDMDTLLYIQYILKKPIFNHTLVCYDVWATNIYYGYFVWALAWDTFSLLIASNSLSRNQITSQTFIFCVYNSTHTACNWMFRKSLVIAPFCRVNLFYLSLYLVFQSVLSVMQSCVHIAVQCVYMYII